LPTEFRANRFLASPYQKIKPVNPCYYTTSLQAPFNYAGRIFFGNNKTAEHLMRQERIVKWKVKAVGGTVQYAEPGSLNFPSA
jgi:hypothetical protein